MKHRCVQRIDKNIRYIYSTINRFICTFILWLGKFVRLQVEWWIRFICVHLDYIRLLAHRNFCSSYTFVHWKNFYYFPETDLTHMDFDMNPFGGNIFLNALIKFYSDMSFSSCHVFIVQCNCCVKIASGTIEIHLGVFCNIEYHSYQPDRNCEHLEFAPHTHTKYCRNKSSRPPFTNIFYSTFVAYIG